MNAERWDKIKALLTTAQDRPDDERAEFLTEACEGDEELKNEVERLLDSSKDDEFLESSAVAEVASIFDADRASETNKPPSEPAQPRFEPGTILNKRYEIVRVVGKGGMGEVFLANDTRINRSVALKFLHTDLVSSKESLRRFAVEAQAVSALNHPHIMTIYEFDSASDGSLFFVAEYIDGQTLNNQISANLKLENALDIAIQISTALSAAHDAGITHRDIKPENVMVRSDGYIKILDFGLAKLTDPGSVSKGSGSEDATQALHKTKPGAVMGTAAYMSPEQARGIDVDPRTDIWSLGVVIYEMITGNKPFARENMADIIVSVLSHEPAPMSSYVPNLPPELDWIVSKALSKNVEGRYQTASELRSDLEKIKKRIEFDDTLSRSKGGDSGIRPGAGEDTAVDGIPTSGGAARPTSDGQDDPAAPPPPVLSSSSSRIGPEKRSRMLRSPVVALLLLAAISSAAYLFINYSGASRRIDSIAVLPFENLSGNPELAYVSDGLSESLIDRLSSLPQLKVISRNSSFKFRGPNPNLQDIASQLGARAIVTGSVSRIGDDLMVRIDIVDAAENRQLAGAQYQRKADDLINIRNEIAQAASEQLRVKLTDSQSKRLAETDTENSDAYRYYLNGRVEMNGPDGANGKALDYFERAVALDPDFAAAHSEIAWIYIVKANGADDPKVVIPKATAAVERALAIDPSLAKAHVLQAMINEYQFDWQGAEREYKRAIDLSPNLDFARNNYAFHLSLMGRQEESLAELEQQRLRDPINRRQFLLQKGIIQVQARMFDDALRTYQEAQAVDPSKDIPYFALGYAYAGKGLNTEAVGYYKKAVDFLGGENKYSMPLVYLAVAYAKMPEKRNEARAILKRIENNGQYTSPALLAAIYTALGENNKAMELLEQAYIKRDLLLRFTGTAFEYDGLRNDPRFADLMKRTGLL